MQVPCLEFLSSSESQVLHPERSELLSEAMWALYSQKGVKVSW